MYGIPPACKDRFRPLVLYRPTGSDDYKERSADYIDTYDVAYNPDTVVDWVPFNRKCMVINPAGDREFVCYDMSPTTNADEYFAAYVNATEGFNAYMGLHVYGTAIEGAENETNFNLAPPPPRGSLMLLSPCMRQLWRRTILWY